MSLSSDLAFAGVIAHADTRLSGHDRAVMAAVAAHGLPSSLDHLCAWFPYTPRPYVFYAVARLEDLGYLGKGAIR